LRPSTGNDGANMRRQTCRITNDLGAKNGERAASIQLVTVRYQDGEAV